MSDKLGAKTGWAKLTYTPEELERKLYQYRKKCANEKKVMTIAGFADYIKISRRTLERLPATYYGEEFAEILELLKTMCEADVVEKTFAGKCNPAFAIFYLKVLHGWKESDGEKEKVPVKIEFVKNETKIEMKEKPLPKETIDLELPELELSLEDDNES